ncbi:MAG TPA: DUF4070 domain-containing protein [Methylomirabilota bacterium]|nr:DUF4070 domain-containing protein [Methylomirabilota bacterium]
MERETLIAGYKRVLSTLYDPTLRNYFERCWVLMQQLPRRGDLFPVSPGATAGRRTDPGSGCLASSLFLQAMIE